ncbi:ABC transporter substrate-binding protein [Candidatus Woesearchaeota archaeon]|jgi:branched-chain amino acid transport system substrate-binding protein|nr:ABC transporter substrate-binding protein [Candidatus Woesearchaeota archaeon]MBT4367987.1 ABC transporter substrate-binding protein [Candidatus Woesearchaeota archaeon]MBT4712475.1 ABC transporter substrate-binding protein [Candidatus Woesearchaeota archaeon]MBT6639388.1 ABC transporter substrate-binding protein [Candidatus Woesearchaeota archaeon]MBT7133560.1 ABC transporter substrate-binding protein [Candidatus Woesearchaeota archaeon]
MKYIIIILATLLLLTACNTTKEETTNIGVVATLSGYGSYLGEQEIKGITLAQDHLNANGGINNKQVKLIIEDSQTSAPIAVTATNKLASIDEVEFIIGDDWGSNTVVMLPIINTNKIVTLSPNSPLKATSKEDFFFKTNPNAADFMRVLAEYAHNDLKLNKVTILTANNFYAKEHGDEFENAFIGLGGEIIIDMEVDINNKDLRTELLKIKNSDSEAVMIIHTTPQTGETLKQAKELGIKTIWLSQFAMQDSTLVKGYGDIVNDLIYVYPYENGNDYFANSYKAKYNELPDMIAASSYDSLMLIAEAIEEVGEDTEAVKNYLLQIENYEGASGTLSFDENGDVMKPIYIKQIKNGEFVVLK